jgi:hypothetical protein
MPDDAKALWTYKPRADGIIPLNLDNNMWNWLFKYRSVIRLVEELPQPEFKIFIPREVEIEHQAIPKSEDKLALTDFIGDTISECDIETTAHFGFAAEAGEVERCGGFNFGTFIELDEVHRIDEMRNFYGSRRPSGLARDEADVQLANQSCYTVVLSRDSKAGPLTYAKERGGKVLFVDDRHAQPGALRAAVHFLLGS